MKKTIMIFFVIIVSLAIIASTGCKGEVKQEEAAETTAAGESQEIVFAPETLNDYGTGDKCRFTAGGGELFLEKVTDLPEFPKADEKYTIGFANYFAFDDCGSQLMKYVPEAGEECGVEVLAYDCNWDPIKQAETVDAWIMQGVDGVILSALDPYGIEPTLEKLHKAGIPIVCFENPPLVNYVDCVVIPDPWYGGYMAAEYLVKALGEKADNSKIAILRIPEWYWTIEGREGGFRQYLREQGLNTEIIIGQGLEVEDHADRFENILQAHPDLTAGYGTYSSAGIGMVQATLAMDRMDDVTLVGWDLDRPVHAAVKEGHLVASPAYSMRQSSSYMVAHMVNILNGNADIVPAITWMATEPILPENADEMYEIFFEGETLKDYMEGKLEE
ncbi:MAG: sugar ABC transporter substrate-binding protein [Actinobacteria bacterium]|nr:sugar ABC transporter substrate-binding protein [Actinomycetota bacterium]